MANFVMYASATGAISFYGNVPDEDLALQVVAAGTALLSGVNTAGIAATTHFVLAGAIAPRPVVAFDKLAITADDADTATLSGLPDPCIVTIAGVDHTITGGVLEVTSAQRASFEISIPDWRAFPAQAFSATVIAS